MLRIGQISYVNVAPFFHFWDDENIEFIKGPPKYLGRLAREGKLDAAPLPVFDAFALDDTFEPLGSFGISAAEKVMSVMLFSKIAIENLNGSAVSLTTESSTSVALLKLLFQERFRHSGIRFASESPDAVLLIGDKALEESGKSGNWPYIYDLAQLWYEWTSLPFTFAQWVVRKHVPLEEKEKLARTLSKNLDRAFSHLEEVCASESARAGVPRGTLQVYLRNFTFRLGPEEEKGIALFKSKISGML